MKTTTLKIAVLMLWAIAGTAWADTGTAEISGLTTPFTLSKIAPFSSGDVSQDKDVCVYSSTGKYQVTVSGIGSSGNFTASLPNKKPIDYEVWWNNSSGTAGGSQSLRAGEPRTFTQLGDSNATCTTASGNLGYWANLQVVIREGQLQGAHAGFYAPALQIDVTTSD